MSTNPKDEPQYALVVKVEDKDVGKSHTDSGHGYGVSTSYGIGISLDEGTFKITDTVESGQAYSGGARKGDYLVGVNGVRLAEFMVKPFSVKEFSSMMKVAERPLVLNINHIAKKTVAKQKAPPAPAMPPAKTGNPMICVFVFCLALSAVVVGVLMGKGDDKPILPPPKCYPTIKELGKYPDYVGDPITGTVHFAFKGTSVQVAYHLNGVEAACSKAGDKDNSCGIHIHAGTSCATTAEPGGHYYDSATVAVDPWKTVTYSGGMSGGGSNSTGLTSTVEYGYNATSTYGHVFVVHNRAGDRVTCAVIEDSCHPLAPELGAIIDREVVSRFDLHQIVESNYQLLR
jgi:hypothetical protein